jgi:hypothetical protein
MDELDAETTLPHLLEIQRRIPSIRFGGKFIVGGHAQLVTIRRDGVVADKIVHTWPDEIGKLSAGAN